MALDRKSLKELAAVDIRTVNVEELADITALEEECSGKDPADRSRHFTLSAIFDRVEFFTPWCQFCELLIGHLFRWPVFQQEHRLISGRLL